MRTTNIDSEDGVRGCEGRMGEEGELGAHNLD